MSYGNELINKVTAADMVDAYNEALAIIDHAVSELDKAKNILEVAFGKSVTSYKYPKQQDLDDEKKRIERQAWGRLIDKMGIRATLSIKRAEELDKILYGEIKKDFPAMTIENIMGMFSGMVEDREASFKEAVLELYEWLRPGASDYNRHITNVKNGRYALGSKIIRTGTVRVGYSSVLCFDVSEYSRKYLLALDNVFHTVAGERVEFSYNSPLIDAIQTSGGVGETKFFKFKCYKNGNLHLEFLRMDVVAQLNAIAGGARFTGENPTKQDLKKAPTKKDYSNLKKDGFFETPKPVKKLMLQKIGPFVDGDVVLEPSAGMGAIAQEIMLTGASVIGQLVLIEKNPTRASFLEQAFVDANVYCDDFLTCPLSAGKYTKILMNPPFEQGQDIDHVMRAYALLASGGRMVAIMSEGSFYRNDNQAMHFKKWLLSVGGQAEKLPPGSFSESGTNVNTRIVVINKK